MLRHDDKNQLERLDRGVGLQANFRYMAGLAATGDTRQRVVGAKPPLNPALSHLETELR